MRGEGKRLPSQGTSRIVWQWLLTSLLLALLSFLFRMGIQFSQGSIIRCLLLSRSRHGSPRET
jgi:hypothetical protein